MKKFFTLVCAIAIAFCASAAPFAPKAELAKKAPVAVEQMQKVQMVAQFEQTPAMNFNQLSATPALKVTNQKAQAPTILGKKVVKANHKAAPAVKPAARKLATGDPTVVIIKGNPSIQPAGSVQIITVEGNDNMVYAWGVKAASLEAGKTYTFADMDMNYTYRCSQDYFTTFEGPTDATFSIDAENNITASMVTESGTYMVYTTAPQPGYETVDVVAISCEIDDYKTDMMYTLFDANNDIYQFDIYYTGSIELGHTYTYDDMDKTYSCYATGSMGYPFETAEFTITENEKGLKHIAATITVPAFNKQFNITWDQPEPQDINVTAVDWAYDDYYYDVYVYSETTTYLFELKEDLVYGKNYTYADMNPTWTCTLSGSYPDITATDATLTVSKDEAGLVHIAATMVLSGNKHVIAYDEKPFEPSGKQINVNGTDLNGRYMSSYGFYLYTATWGDYTVQLAFDATEEKAAYTNEDFIANYGLIYSDDEEIPLFKLASESITITNTETTKTLAGSIYAKNGDEYILNLVYEKPAAKEININVKDATLTNKSTIGFWKIDGQTEDKNNSFSIYFISKALQGTFTDVAQFDSYSTWVSDKSTGTSVYYENLSAVNLTSVVDGDSLKITGTMNLADDKGNPAIVTVYITTPFTQEWGDWADFAPFDLNTGKYTLNAVFGGAVVTNVPVKVRKDNTGLKQYQFLNLGKGYYGTDGINMTLNMNPDNTFTVQPVGATVKTSSGSLNIILTDAYTATHAPQFAAESYYDPESGIFTIYTVALNSTATEVLTANYETMVMDKPITERDTVDVVSTKMTYYEFLATDQAVQFYAGSDATGYTNFVITSKNATTIDGTFDIYDGYCFADSTDGSRITFAEGKITVVKEDDVYHLTGWAIGSNEKYYRLDWTEIVGVLEYDTDAPFEAEYQYTQMEAEIEDGVISIYATKEDGRTISLTLFTNPANTMIPAGTYVISDSQEAATALQSVGVVSGKLTQCWAGIRTESGISDCWFMVEGTITLSYDEYDKLKVVVDAKNSYGQPVTATVKYTKLDPKSIVAIDNATLSIYDGYFAQYGLLDFYGQNTEGYGYDLYAYADTIIGDFLENIDFVDCGIITPNGKISIIDAYSFSVGGIGKALTLTASVLGSDTIQYNISATGYYGALPYDQTSDFEATFELDSAEVQTADAGTGMTNLMVTNDNNQMVALKFYAKAEGNKLPAGTYPINNTKAKNTVLASVGYTTSGFTYSFAAETNDQGQITNPWWMVGGEVVVAEDGSITVNAVNSYDKTITINIVVPVAPCTTDYYLVGWIDGAAYGIEGDIDNFGDYLFVDGKVTATFNEDSYVQVKDCNKQIYGTASYVNPVAEGTSAIVLATGTEKMGVYAGEYEFTLDIAEDGTMTLSYAPVATGLYRINANTAIRKALINGHVVIFKNDKAFNLMGAEL